MFSLDLKPFRQTGPRFSLLNPEPPIMAGKLTSNSYVKEILKDHAGGTQVGEDALEKVDQLFKEFLLKVAQASKQSLEQDKRSKVSAVDIEFGYNSILGQSDVAPDPARFLEALHKMDLVGLGEVLRLIVEWNSSADGKKA